MVSVPRVEWNRARSLISRMADRLGKNIPDSPQWPVGTDGRLVQQARQFVRDNADRPEFMQPGGEA